MKVLILFAFLISACAPASFTAIESTSDLSCVFLPIVINGSAQPSGCEGIQTTITLHYLLEDRFEEYTVVDCLGLEENWEKILKRPEIIEADGRWGIAQQGDPWLQVLIWEGSEDAFILNLTREE